MKQRFDYQLYSRLWFMQRRELGLKVLAHNVKQILYIQEAEHSDLPLWVFEDALRDQAKQNMLDAFFQFCFTRNR
ncbi:MAG: hypothetical protein AB1665_02865 [Candidatus Thermoplasmatota archaeon]